MIATERPSAISALNVLAGEIARVTPSGGADALVEVDCRGDRLLRGAHHPPVGAGARPRSRPVGLRHRQGHGVRPRQPSRPGAFAIGHDLI